MRGMDTSYVGLVGASACSCVPGLIGFAVMIRHECTEKSFEYFKATMNCVYCAISRVICAERTQKG